MLFNSFEFLFFFPTVVVLHFLLPGKRRWAFLLAASYFFYACWDPGYLLLILASTLVDFYAARWLGSCQDRRRRKALLGASLLTNLGILFLFKYFNFFRANLVMAAGWLGFDWAPTSTGWLLPVGISFYTFQTMGYTIDVYRGRLEPVSHLGRFALYVSYFPQLVAGPIERAENLLPQLERRAYFRYERVAQGCALMLWGFFKKVAVADRLALLVDEVYRQPGASGGLDLVLATVCFYAQIYCDFSGYSDIAIGAAAILGVDLMDNFDRPYLATSIHDFWSRWHISLSTWFRDYVYIPLGGNRVGAPRWVANILAVFLLSGLWHGASWTFVLWGLLHSFYYLVERYLGPKVTLPPWLKRLLTFSAVSLAWIFFRSPTVESALLIVSRLATDWHLGFPVTGQLPLRFLLITLAMVGLMLWLDGRQGPGAPRGAFQGALWQRWCTYYLLLACILLYGNYDSQAFIYFQF